VTSKQIIELITEILIICQDGQSNLTQCHHRRVVQSYLPGGANVHRRPLHCSLAPRVCQNMAAQLVQLFFSGLTGVPNMQTMEFATSIGTMLFKQHGCSTSLYIS